MAGRPRSIDEVYLGQMFGVLRVVSPEFYRGRRRFTKVQCTKCNKTRATRITDLNSGYQCKCLTRGRRRGPYL